MVLFFVILLIVILFFAYGTSRGTKIIKEKMGPVLGPRLWTLLLNCKDEKFKDFVWNNVEKAVTALWPKEQDMVIQNVYHTDAFLCGLVLACYRHYVRIHPEKKNELSDLLDRLYLDIPDLVKKELTLSDLPDGWATEHNW